VSAKSPTTIPVTVIGGFLGAGKTTFLNQLLRTGNARYAVLVNDFGAVNIDADLIASHDGATMTLTNGCVCCSIGGDFIETLSKVLDQKTPFDHIIIEASGVGDPWRIAEIALVEPGLRLSAVVVIADASRIESLLADPRVGDTVRNQFERCDMVLLSKTDLTGRATIDAARIAICGLRDGLRIVEISDQAIPDISVLSRQRPAGRFRADAALAGGASHEREFQRWFYQRQGSFVRARLEQVLLELPPQLLRLKGSCRLAGEAHTFVLQMADRNWSLTRSEPGRFSGRPGIMLVGVATTDLKSAGLDAILDRALATSIDAQTGASPGGPYRRALSIEAGAAWVENDGTGEK
jgi:G3E family GTPase